jgi:hypothetical protein
MRIRKYEYLPGGGGGCVYSTISVLSRQCERKIFVLKNISFPRDINPFVILSRTMSHLISIHIFHIKEYTCVVVSYASIQKHPINDFWKVFLKNFNLYRARISVDKLRNVELQTRTNLFSSAVMVSLVFEGRRKKPKTNVSIYLLKMCNPRYSLL